MKHSEIKCLNHIEKERYVKFKADIITDFLRSVPKEIKRRV